MGAKLFNFKPPDKNCLYYFGYNERGMASLYVNMFAATAYWAKVCSHLSGNPNSGNNIVLYQYFDYMFTCPLLTLDLLWTLNLPYKITYSFMVFLTLFSGFAAAGHPQPG
jgi:bacteriorhodopsin